ncbi:MAG: hypothetical protein KDK90_00770 [Leptospiraceae bacterium]|nr:hypothetical protein [Leptospiraceae bacterium]
MIDINLSNAPKDSYIPDGFQKEYSFSIERTMSEAENKDNINKFKVKLESKKSKDEILFIELEKSWRICGYNEKSEFIDKVLDSTDDLATELSKSEQERNDEKIIEKATSKLGRNPKISFLKKAGFYIYNILIRFGIPDDNIAFMTGEKGTLNDFIEDCKFTVVIEPPKNTYEKQNKNSLEGFRNWLSSKVNDPYLTLRRGIIEGCRFYKSKLENIFQNNPNDLEDFILFRKTINPEKSDNFPDSIDYSSELNQYLSKIELYFPISQPNVNRKEKYFSFLLELVKDWEIANKDGLHNYSKRKREDGKDDWYDYNFKNNSNLILKILRNYTAHNLLSKDLKEKDVAFLFMLAMRALFDSDVYQIYPYEKCFERLFDFTQNIDNEKIINLLQSSYKSLFEKRSEPKVYIWLLQDYSIFKGNEERQKKDDFIKNSILLIRYAYFHGLFQDIGAIDKIKFFGKDGNIASISRIFFSYKTEFEKNLDNNFPRYIANLIYKDCV